MIITEDTSDGFHTFKELYHHRMCLTSALTKHIGGIRSQKHSDGTMFSGMFIVVFEVNGKQCSYHYHLSNWEFFDHLETVEFAPEWDGHTSDDVCNILLEK